MHISEGCLEVDLERHRNTPAVIVDEAVLEKLIFQYVLYIVDEEFLVL